MVFILTYHPEKITVSGRHSVPLIESKTRLSIETLKYLWSDIDKVNRKMRIKFIRRKVNEHQADFETTIICVKTNFYFLHRNKSLIFHNFFIQHFFDFLEKNSNLCWVKTSLHRKSFSHTLTMYRQNFNRNCIWINCFELNFV